MSTLRDLLTQRLHSAFTKAGITVPDGMTIEVQNASDTRFGDYQSNAAMVVAKAVKSNPRQLATTLVENLEVSDLCETPTIAGPGFLNFRITKTKLGTLMPGLRSDVRIGVPAVEKPLRIVVDFSAPNIAKPMHVGHIRSTFLGDALARIARFAGHQVITDNHVGDWGTQFGMIIHGWKTRLNKDALKKDAIHELVRVYREVNAATKADETVLELCKTELVKLQKGDAENLSIWHECVKLTLDQLHDVYGRLDIHFDHYLGESFYNDALAPLVEDMLAKKIAQISEGAVCVFVTGDKPGNSPELTRDSDAMNAAPCLIRKSDGGFLYATTDLATIDYRVREWKADQIWYVVGAPQQLHFRQVFAIAHMRGHSSRMEHIEFGSILGPDGKMFKTRSGESVGLLEVIDEAIERSRLVVAEREGLSDEEKSEIAEVIGIGSVKYAELSQHRMTDYKFAWDKMLSLQGNTAPYLINAYVRTRAIFRKLDGNVELRAECELTEDAERNLALKLAQFGEAVHDVLNEDFRPNLLAQYLFELSNTFHSFYEACPVLRSEGIMRNTRLVLCDLTSSVLKKGLGLLGIKTTERM
jgi:arginyl-tRNA synthetase